MKKLKMALDRLQVETFDTGACETARGTVRAHLTWTDPRVCPATANWYCTAGDCSKYPEACTAA